MDFRTHLGRQLDFRNRANIAVLAVCAVAGAIGVWLWLSGEPGTVVLSPVYAFLTWALLQEIDPDHNWTALAGAILTAAWGLAGGPVVSGLAIAGMMIAARIVTSTTGRRPLLVDLVVVTVFGIVIGYTAAGWAGGFGIAIAIYLDDRLSGDDHRVDRHRGALMAASITAIGTTVVATASGAFTERLGDIEQWAVLAAGAVALILLIRDPAPPVSQVDARHAAFISEQRLHVSRSLIGCLVFVASILTGSESPGLVVLVVALGLAVISNEVESLRRRRL
jgi:hypothetical protein